MLVMTLYALSFICDLRVRYLRRIDRPVLMAYYMGWTAATTVSGTIVFLWHVVESM